MGQIVAIDLGNTHLCWGVFDAERLVRAGRLPIAEPWSLPIDEWRRAEVVIVGSVNRKAERRLVKDWSWEGAPRLERLGLDLPIPVEVSGPDRDQVGADRLLNALAWHHRSARPAVIVDFGTAITLDIVSRDGQYRGGAILPGPGLISRSLERGTSLLPLVDMGPESRIFGQDTRTAVRRGVFGMICGGVRYLVDDLRRYLEPDCVVLGTGGGAPRFAPGIPAIDRIVPHLTLEGVRLSYLASISS